MHFARALHVDAGDAVRRRQRNRTADQDHVGAGPRTGLRQRIAHLARAGIGDAAHRIHRLEGRPGGQHHRATGQQLGREMGQRMLQQRLRLQHAALAGLAAGLFAGIRPPDGDAVTFEQGDVALRGGVLPHLAVHRRRDDERAGARRAQRGEQVVAQAVGDLRHHVGGGGRDQHGVGVAREVDVRHVVVHARIPQILPDRIAGQRLEGDGGDEARAGGSEHHVHISARLAEQAREFRRLVGSDTARHRQHQFATLQLHRENSNKIFVLN